MCYEEAHYCPRCHYEWVEHPPYSVWPRVESEFDPWRDLFVARMQEALNAPNPLLDWMQQKYDKQPERRPRVRRS